MVNGDTQATSKKIKMTDGDKQIISENKKMANGGIQATSKIEKWLMEMHKSLAKTKNG